MEYKIATNAKQSLFTDDGKQDLLKQSNSSLEIIFYFLVTIEMSITICE